MCIINKESQKLQTHRLNTQYYIYETFFLQSYTALNWETLTNVKIKTQNFKQCGSHVMFTYSFIFFKLGGNTTQTNKNIFYMTGSKVECCSEWRILSFDVD
jgi:hypothetical protein